MPEVIAETVTVVDSPSVEETESQEVVTPEKNVLAFDDYDTSEATKTETTPTETSESKETTDNEAKATETLDKEGKAPEEVVSEKPSLVPPRRDYSKYSPEEVEVLKHLPNKAFAKATALLEANKAKVQELDNVKKQLDEAKKGGLPENWFEHEAAFTLSPEYNETQTSLYDAHSRAEHWKQQLINIEKGEQWTKLAYDKSGNLVAVEPQDASPEAKYMVQEAFQESLGMKNTLGQKLQQIQGSFKQRYQSVSQGLLDGVKEQVNKLPEGIKPKDKQAEEIVASLPKEFQRHPLANVVGVLYAVAKNQASLLQQLSKQQEVQKLNLQDAKKAGTKVKTTANLGVKATDVINFDELAEEFNE